MVFRPSFDGGLQSLSSRNPMVSILPWVARICGSSRYHILGTGGASS